MLNTPNLSLPYIDLNEAQREVVHNEAIRGLDALVQLAVLDRSLATPPGSPSDGQRWLVAASSTGAWSGHATEIAAWQDGAWRFYVPRTGWLVYVVDEGALIAWNGSAWVDALSVLTSLQNVALLGVGTTADATNPLSAKLNNTLWVAKTVAEGGDGHLRYKLSKESAAKTLSLLMQTNFSGRAEIGLIGDDDFHFKVSADGSTWFESLIISRSSGKIGLGIDGSVSAPALTWAGDPDNGIYRTGANAWSLACAGVQALGLTSTAVSVAHATAASSTTTGALTVAGGLGVAGAAYVGAGLFSSLSGGAAGTFSGWTSISGSNSSLNGEIRLGANTTFQGRIAYDGAAGGDLYVINTWDSASGDIVLRTSGSGSPKDWRFTGDGGFVTAGSPTGGNRGLGSINAVAVYDDNVLLTDYVFDKYAGCEAKYSPRVRALADALDPAMFEIDSYVAFWRDNHRLYGMPDLNDCIDGIVKEVSLGDMVQRLTQTAELHAIHIGAIDDRLAALESASVRGAS